MSMRFLKINLPGKVFIWLVAEILLTNLGIDDMADYSEFIFDSNLAKIKIEKTLKPTKTNDE